MEKELTKDDYEMIAKALLGIRPEQWDEYEKRKEILLREQDERGGEPYGG